ncbi:MAG: hypothetical protein HKP61_20690 [Dactylosporangium sp.]|nr:hypothetical protein [Dactylosporangium sp.]NNJ63301.1 hypothetical protein [Dactylosporangium sp.]
MRLDDLSVRLDVAGDALAEAGNALERLPIGAETFGGDARGQLGELGRQLYAGWAAATAARAREANAHAERLAAAATGIRVVAAGYRDAERCGGERGREDAG